MTLENYKIVTKMYDHGKSTTIKNHGKSTPFILVDYVLAINASELRYHMGETFYHKFHNTF